MNWMRKFASIVVVLAVAGLVPASTTAAAATPCSAPASSSGDWPSFGHDLSNSRHQTLERSIGVSNVGKLTAKWSFSSSADGGATGAFQSTPVEAGGCLFMTAASISTPTAAGPFDYVPIDYDQYALGWVFAVDAATGRQVWRASLGPVLNINFFGGVFSPTVEDGRVFVLVGSTVPSVVALDQHTGATLWQTQLADPGVHGALASVRVFHGLVFAAVVGGDGSDARTPFYLLDAKTGAVVKKTYMHTMEQWQNGHAGGGMWGTAVVDRDGYLYNGTSNPYGQVEDKYNNSIVKIDVNPKRKSTFGTVVDTFMGTRDNDPKRGGDVDFGASPNLFAASDGRVLVGDLQKSGEYHAVDVRSMQRLWTDPLAPANAGGNAATGAVDDTNVYVAPNKGVLYALDQTTGATRWAAKYPESTGHYQPVSVANGIVYTINNKGELLAFDARTGKILLKKLIVASTGPCVWSAGGGVAIANGYVYAACDKGGDGGGIVVAYGLK
jgi:outer membrane protein assembly factor BamB